MNRIKIFLLIFNVLISLKINSTEIDDYKTGMYIPDFRAVLINEIVGCKTAKDYEIFVKAALNANIEYIAYIYSKKTCIKIKSGYEFQGKGWYSGQDGIGYEIEIFANNKNYHLWTNYGLKYESEKQEINAFLNKKNQNDDFTWMSDKFIIN